MPACVLPLTQPPSQSQLHRASVARAYIETKYKNLNQESQDREESQQKIQLLNARMDQMGIAESERDMYRQRVWQEVRKGIEIKGEGAGQIRQPQHKIG